MIIEPLIIEGAYKISPKRIGDDRGSFARLYCSKTFKEKGLNTNWIQTNVSISTKKATIRGIHYQKLPYGEIKLVRCVQGKIFDIIVDLRKKSKTYGKSLNLILDSDTLDTVYIPEGCAHGFQTLTNYVELHYSHSQEYKPEYEAGIYFNDPDLEIDWPLIASTLSERDKTHPLLKTIEPIDL
ncbi:dTDP-4-dehydrorhamnose 3,5-epimerase [Amylibacter sp.]|jgi:dTDP-4-dehydrorhamnose 3,5-epimerase|nr:dTDP-4-dehydrorhamnose 3,5-epimerase [Amylibacter sp.]|tara:strand:+ start:675 stop:1223 length:549 start_codon:yes stop_codon:yes gene_type:complete